MRGQLSTAAAANCSLQRVDDGQHHLAERLIN